MCTLWRHYIGGRVKLSVAVDGTCVYYYWGKAWAKVLIIVSAHMKIVHIMLVTRAGGQNVREETMPVDFHSSMPCYR